MLFSSSRLVMLLLFVTSLGGWQTEAHPMPDTEIQFKVKDEVVTGVAYVPMPALEKATKLHSSFLTETFLIGYFADHIMARSTKGLDWNTHIKSITIVTQNTAAAVPYKEVEVYFSLTPPSGESLRKFDFYYDAITHEITTHKVSVFVGYDWGKGKLTNDLQSLGIIKADTHTGITRSLPIRLSKATSYSGYSSMFVMGLQHIAKGFDHILFLITLLLVTPLSVTEKKWSDFSGWRYTLRRFLQISLAFTIGHSFTLVLGSFGLLNLSGNFVEPLIAISVIVAAIHCIRPIFYNREVVIALTFGLVHGMAFSSVLSVLDLSTSTKLLSILSFNLGIEVMQLLIMLAFLPFIALSKWNKYRYIRMAMAAIIIVLATSWFVQRVSGNSVNNQVIELVDR